MDTTTLGTILVWIGGFSLGVCFGGILGYVKGMADASD